MASAPNVGGRTSAGMARALKGVRVLEYCDGLSGPFCTKLMADLGAEVVHVEPPRTGDEARRLPPFVGDVPDNEKSAVFLFLNTNKLGITLEPGHPAGADMFRALVREVDIVVDESPPGRMESLGLGYEDLRALNPGLVMASITPFGRSGAYKSYKARALNISHVSGQGYMLPMPSPHLERPPVRIGGNCTDYDAGQSAAVAILAALYRKRLTGKGQFVEISQHEAVLSLQRIENVVSANGGERLTRKGPAADRNITNLFRCKDGYVVSVAPLQHQKDALAKLTQDEAGIARAHDPNADPAAVAEATRRRLAAWMEHHTAEEVCAKAQRLGIPVAPMSSPADVVRSAQMNARGFFGQVEHPVAGAVRMPIGLCHFSRTPFRLEHAAPRLGEHNERVYRQRLGLSADALHTLQQRGVI